MMYIISIPGDTGVAVQFTQFSYSYSLYKQIWTYPAATGQIEYPSKQRIRQELELALFLVPMISKVHALQYTKTCITWGNSLLSSNRNIVISWEKKGNTLTGGNPTTSLAINTVRHVHTNSKRVFREIDRRSNPKPMLCESCQKGRCHNRLVWLIDLILERKKSQRNQSTFSIKTVCGLNTILPIGPIGLYWENPRNTCASMTRTPKASGQTPKQAIYGDIDMMTDAHVM